MAEVKWIKFSTDMFNDEKIRLIESMPEGDALIVIWCKLLCMAGKTNDGGYVYMGQGMAYTDEMLATIMNKPLNTVRLALKTFESFCMVTIDDNGIYLNNWATYQNIEGLERVRELGKARVSKFRKKQRLLQGIITCQYCGKPATGVDHIIPLSAGGSEDDSNKVPCCLDCNMHKTALPLVTFLNYNLDRINHEMVQSSPKLMRYVRYDEGVKRYVTLRNETDIDIDSDKDIDSNTPPTPSSEDIPYSEIVNAYNETCVGLPKVALITDARRKAMRARWNEHQGTEAFQELFTMAASMPFLNGKNDRNWTANFDWLLKEQNWAKVIEGKYREVKPGERDYSAGRGAGYCEQHTEDEYAQFYAN